MWHTAPTHSKWVIDGNVKISDRNVAKRPGVSRVAHNTKVRSNHAPVEEKSHRQQGKGDRRQNKNDGSTENTFFHFTSKVQHVPSIRSASIHYSAADKRRLQMSTRVIWAVTHNATHWQNGRRHKLHTQLTLTPVLMTSQRLFTETANPEASLSPRRYSLPYIGLFCNRRVLRLTELIQNRKEIMFDCSRTCQQASIYRMGEQVVYESTITRSVQQAARHLQDGDTSHAHTCKLLHTL